MKIPRHDWAVQPAKPESKALICLNSALNTRAMPQGSAPIGLLLFTRQTLRFRATANNEIEAFRTKSKLRIYMPSQTLIKDGHENN